MVTSAADVFSLGLVAQKLAMILAYPEVAHGYLFYTTMQCLRRILIRKRRFRHGGALLFDDAPSRNRLRLKHLTNYWKRRAAIELCSSAEAAIRFSPADGAPIEEQYSWLLDDVVARHQCDDAQEAMLGSVGVIASLSRIDGLVLLGKQSEVEGFGGEILAKHDPPAVIVSRTTGGT